MVSIALVTGISIDLLLDQASTVEAVDTDLDADLVIAADPLSGGWRSASIDPAAIEDPRLSGVDAVVGVSADAGARSTASRTSVVALDDMAGRVDMFKHEHGVRHRCAARPPADHVWTTRPARTARSAPGQHGLGPDAGPRATRSASRSSASTSAPRVVNGLHLQRRRRRPASTCPAPDPGLRRGEPRDQRDAVQAQVDGSSRTTPRSSASEHGRLHRLGRRRSSTSS